jgi:hypothetical protein
MARARILRGPSEHLEIVAPEDRRAIPYADGLWRLTRSHGEFRQRERRERKAEALVALNRHVERRGDEAQMMEAVEVRVHAIDQLPKYSDASAQGG